ncbi:hypothetical protein MW887_000718 [Aspergillus wentii]|nr:hypothetical protein MW887_000718 [Aspergillus wentii]
MATSTGSSQGPCTNCRERHVRCDRQGPKCQRCQNKGLDCLPVQRKSVFRHGSAANFEAQFSDDQPWVNSEPRRWRSLQDSSVSLRESNSVVQAAAPTGRFSVCPTVYAGYDLPASQVHEGQNRTSHSAQASKRQRPDGPVPGLFHDSPLSVSSLLSSSDSGVYVPTLNEQGHDWAVGNSLGHSELTTQGSSRVNDKVYIIQEACLLRYFIEEISPWFDHCDEQRHFQLEIPKRAKHCLALRNAIFAVASCHLSRLPYYTTPHGIVYHGQQLPDLKSSTAVEYMLNCIPDLIKFPEIQDPNDQESLMAAAIILRQYEEMEEEIDESHMHQRVNFLAITQTIIDSMMSSPTERSLANAAYWIAIRQEVYYALTRERVPIMQFGHDDWGNASVANKFIMFAGEVTKWRWGGKSSDGWDQLKELEKQLMHDYMSQLIPILERKADKSQGEIFPTVWYAVDSQVTAVQHLELARMILIAENPHLE